MGNKVISIDPVTRVEGHLKIEVELDKNNKVVEAKASGNLYRDFENILQNRHPWDAVHITQRICGICPISHNIVSVKAAEQAAGFTPSDQVVLLRSLMQGGNFLQDHILHFYHLSLMDYIVGPQLSPWSPGYNSDMRVNSTDTQRLINNYLEALKIRRQAQEMVALFAGRVPHIMTNVPGGVTATVDESKISQFKSYLSAVTNFINSKYLPDAEFLANAYSDYNNIGKGPGNLISFGVFDLPGGSTLYKRGRITGGTGGSVDAGKISEYVQYSYYSSASGLNPAEEDTVPAYGKGGAYSWLKAPRYEGEVYETGPLARMKVNGDYSGGTSVMDRLRARALETRKIAAAMSNWIGQVSPGPSQGANAYTDITLAASGSGIGLTEAPRGALGHWLQYSNTSVTRYQVITPTCWNASPKDDNGKAGAVEQALIGTVVANPDQPIELLRVVHSFDPCTGCSVHVINPEKGIDKEFIVQGFVGGR